MLESRIIKLKQNIETVNHITGHNLNVSNRFKRKIFDGVSYVINWLFGIPDANDAEFYENSIKTLLQDNQSYEDFEEMLLDNYDSKEVWDQLSAQFGRRNKSTEETMAEFLEQKGVLARCLKLDDELHLAQLVDMFGPEVLPYLQASQPVPPTHETREEKIVIPKNNAEVNDVGEMDKEAESHANFEGDADAEVDVVRDKEINIDPEEDKTVEEKIIGKEILDKVTSVIVRQDLEPLDHAIPVVLGDLHTHGCKQCPREEVHAQSGTQEVSKQNAPRRKGESDVLFNRPRHHSTDTKADALRMSDAENGKVRERTRSPSGEKSARNFANDSSRKFDNFHTQSVNHQQERRRLLGRGGMLPDHHTRSRRSEPY
ncbi:hypothetical protein FQA39_LY14309 [Lamprigera yunnana]|nr:hypothetical protein FQA39_LY14309 [Lamprigera yunnana]